ncbi:MAG: hypothetical protein EZS26_002932 [Candidatus Ordinivivax streblomastigis]|uniref:Uncharacterized protein n=1 Tax=Candidatus Ordinivivax streblomastigis TaxID=2540710 RepID=A0A5M8NVM1_9BACT|nr:MAG: hypothetical protein EZS26_002932 [Candidatus Ordinivivax streblomastigis]
MHLPDPLHPINKIQQMTQKNGTYYTKAQQRVRDVEASHTFSLMKDLVLWHSAYDNRYEFVKSHRNYLGVGKCPKSLFSQNCTMDYQFITMTFWHKFRLFGQPCYWTTVF